MSFFGRDHKTLWRRWVLARLLWLILAVSLGQSAAHEKVHERQEKGQFLRPLLTSSEAESDILSSDVDADHERFSRETGSGSGDDPLTPSYTPSVYIELTLQIAPDKYERSKETILMILETYLDATTTLRKRATSGGNTSIVLELDREKSSNATTVLRVFVVDSESGDLNIDATSDLYDALLADRVAFYKDIKDKTTIVVLDVQFIRDPSAGIPLKSSSLKWWDILMIALGCVAAATCPLLLVLAVSHMRMRVPDALFCRQRARLRKSPIADVRTCLVCSWLEHIKRLLAMAGRICEAITFCCRWFTRRREDEEKEGLLTRDAQLLDDTAPQVQTNQPRVAGGGLRERASVNNNNEDVYSDWERRDHVRRVARVGFQSRVQVQSHPLGQDEIETLLQNPATLRKEYSSIPSNLATMADVPPGAEEKNRYKDILPSEFFFPADPQTRVSLFLKFAVANSDYINANFIRGLQDSERAYIAAQGPLPWTVDDFWRMVWEQKTSVIVMVTGLEERRIVKCAQYWPDPHVTLTANYGDLNVTLKKRVTTNPNYTVSHFHVTHREKLVSREVTHFWFTAWPDHGVPSSTEPALQFLSHIRSHAQDIPAPIIVHCRWARHEYRSCSMRDTWFSLLLIT
ncbi:Tyrosine-protein phosphatase non-receptor type 7 [Geodia barretti]|uniref:Tyrosine-protein phosphatase non-receptor type 7 n=1 Tax=Geodia barretti TaxID=519541 RepID=A0AA35QZ33_GEOBA|nr:Tyrosine-protein phosphatase non-receptor type 7 [Geodia barretti]